MIKQIFKRLLLGRSVENIYCDARRYWKKGGVYRYWSLYLTKKIQKDFGCYLSPQAIVGKNLKLKHPVGVVIGDGVVVGNNVTLFQHVTLGAARLGEGKEGLYPILEDNVIVFAGAVVVGGILLGNRSVVGANSVVLNNVNASSVVVGIPAKPKGNNGK